MDNTKENDFDRLWSDAGLDDLEFEEINIVGTQAKTDFDKELDELGDLYSDEIEKSEESQLINESLVEQVIEVPIEKPEILLVESVSREFIDKHKKRIGEIYDLARDELFDDNLDQELWRIIVDLIDIGMTPVELFYGKKPKGNVGAYHRRIQTADLYFVWRWHRGRKSFGGFAGIFEGEAFNQELAEKIAMKKLPMYGDKGKNGKIDADALALHDVDEIQAKLAVLISDKVRQRQDDKQNALDRFHNRKLQIEAQLKAYKQANNSRMDIPTHLAVWEAIEQAGGRKSKPSAIRDAYGSITGKPINSSILRDKRGQLEKALKWRRV